MTLNDLVGGRRLTRSAAPRTGGLIRVSQDDVCLLKVARTRSGVDVALTRLVNAAPPAPIPAPPPEQ